MKKLQLKDIKVSTVIPFVEYCIKNKDEKDKIYVYYRAKNAFEYYTYNIKCNLFIIGKWE